MIKKLSKQKWVLNTAWSVGEKVLNYGSLLDKKKVGDIITCFCKAEKVKEAHLVYLMEKEKNLTLQRSGLDFLTCGLAPSDETVPLS